jgi:hypothetical protein
MPQSLSWVQPAQLPAPSHARFPVGPHAVPLGAGGCEGTPLVQMSCVQGLESLGTSLLSATIFVPPCPSHTTCWQSPAVWWLVGNPTGSLLIPHVPLVHTRCAQSVSVPGQSVATLHSVPPIPEAVPVCDPVADCCPALFPKVLLEHPACIETKLPASPATASQRFEWA